MDVQSAQILTHHKKFNILAQTQKMHQYTTDFHSKKQSSLSGPFLWFSFSRTFMIHATTWWRSGKQVEFVTVKLHGVGWRPFIVLTLILAGYEPYIILNLVYFTPSLSSDIIFMNTLPIFQTPKPCNCAHLMLQQWGKPQ